MNRRTVKYSVMFWSLTSERSNVYSNYRGYAEHPTPAGVEPYFCINISINIASLRD